MKSLLQRLTLLLIGSAGLIGSLFITNVNAQESVDPLLYSQQAVDFTSASSGATRPGLTLPGTATAYDNASIVIYPSAATLFRDECFVSSLGATNTN